MKTLGLQLRFLIPLVLILVGAAYFSVPLMDQLTLRWFARDLDMRGELVANALSESLAEAASETRGRKLQSLFDRAVQDERLVAIGWCSPSGQLVRRTTRFPKELTCIEAAQVSGTKGANLQIEGGPVHVSVHPITTEAGPVGQLVLMHDLSFIERRSQDTRKYLMILIAALGAAIALVTLIVAQLSARGWIAGARALLRGEGLLAAHGAASPELAPLAADLRDRLARPGGRIPAPAGRRRRMDAQAAAGAAAHPAARRRGDGRVQPRALHPRAPRQRAGGAAAGQRPGDGGWSR